MKEFFHHLFIPRESNNHRAKVLHNHFLFFSIIILLVVQMAFGFVKTQRSDVLGISTDLSVTELVNLTNEKRQEQGLTPLRLSITLSQAASLKANDMFAKDYWAHNAPDGTTPWFFFQKVNYDYLYAGENLARGFTSSKDVINAWMASPTHRDNMLSANYKEIGFAIREGRLLEENTTLIVEHFGSRNTIIGESEKDTNSLPIINEKTAYQVGLESLGATNKNTPLIDSFFASRNISVFILSFFIFVLVIDMVIIERKKIVRFVGHNIDHILFLGAFLIMILLIRQGIVL